MGRGSLKECMTEESGQQEEGKWAVGSEQWAVSSRKKESGQWAVSSEQQEEGKWAVGSGQ